MFYIDNLTVVYLIGLVSLSYGIVQGLTLRDEFQSSLIWAAGQILLGIGFVGLVYYGKDPLTKAWIASYAILVLGTLTQLTAIARFGKNPIPQIPAIACLAGLAVVVVLFEAIRELGAPLASLETFLFAPLAAVYIYMAWFSWKMGRIANSIYLTIISIAFWLYAVLMTLTLLMSLFDLGRNLIDITSMEIGVLAIASLILSLVTNYLWSIQAAELSQTDIHLINFDIALEAKANAIPVFVNAPSKKGLSKKPAKESKALAADSKKEAAHSPAVIDQADQSDKDHHLDKQAKLTASKAAQNKPSAAKAAELNLELLSLDEQAALVAQLTEREKEVFILAADGMKNGQIAQALNSSESSIKVHRSRMVSKLGSGDIAILAKLKQNLNLTAAVTTASVIATEVVVEEATQAAIEPVIELSSNNPDSLFTNHDDPSRGT
jgi:DNA-binding CsgD family transcriptional regulator